jgi:hypothetical protein
VIVEGATRGGRGREFCALIVCRVSAVALQVRQDEKGPQQSRGPGSGDAEFRQDLPAFQCGEAMLDRSPGGSEDLVGLFLAGVELAGEASP